MAVSKCMSDASLKSRWASQPGGESLPSRAELCHCLWVEDGRKVEASVCKHNALSSVRLLLLLNLDMH